MKEKKCVCVYMVVIVSVFVCVDIENRYKVRENG